MCVLVRGSCQGLVFRYCLSAAAGSILCGLGLAWLSVFNRITNLNYAAAAVCVCVCVYLSLYLYVTVNLNICVSVCIYLCVLYVLYPAGAVCVCGQMMMDHLHNLVNNGQC